MTKVRAIKRIEKNQEERKALISLVVDSAFINQIGPITRIEYFKSQFAQRIATWCLDHWKEYKEAPGPIIEEVYKTKERANELDPDEADLILQFLEGLSEEYSNTSNRSTEYYAKTTEQYFRKRALELLKEEIDQRIQAGDIEGAEEELNNHKPPTREAASYVNPWTDQQAILSAFEEQSEPLFKLPRDLGEAWNTQFVRDALIGILAPEKRGKSYFLMKMGMLAYKAGKKVAFFAVGDMTQPQMLRRFGIMLARRSDKQRYCGKILLPVLDCYHNQTGTCEHFGRIQAWDKEKEELPNLILDEAKGTFKEFAQVPDWIPCNYCQKDKEFKQLYQGTTWMKERPPVTPLTWREAYRNGMKYAGDNPNFRLSCHKNTSMNIRGIEAILANWKSADGFKADVVLIDYADILAPEDTREEFRHRQNTTWKAMRALSQEENCLVITATQADAASYSAEILKESNFSEDKRKYSHVTAIMTLNQLPEDKQKKILRIGQMFLREDEFDAGQTVTVLQSLATGQPIMGNFLTPRKKKEKKG